MVSLKTIEKSNTQLPQLFAKSSPVALFVGATNGVGRNTLRTFVKSVHGTKPRIYFVGRSRQRGEELKAELLAIDPDGTYEFIAADVSEMASVDNICRQIIQQEKYLNLLFMSQGTTQPGTGKLCIIPLVQQAQSGSNIVHVRARKLICSGETVAAETSEKIPFSVAVFYYSKVRFAVNLLPLLKEARALRRVVSLFGAGLEGKVLVDDLDGRKSSALKARDNKVSMTSLTLDKLSKENPDVSWIHAWPGFVDSGIWDGLPGFIGIVFRTLMPLLGFFFYMNPEECGQRQTFISTSSRFPSASGDKMGAANGVGLVDNIGTIMSINGKVGGGSYSVRETGDAVDEKKISLLVDYENDGTQDIIWKHTVETFQKVTGKERL